MGRGVVGGTLVYLRQDYFYKIQSGLGRGTKNYAELMSFKLLLLFVIEKGVHMLLIYGDSEIVINWFNEISRCHMHILCHILDEILHLKQHFDQIPYVHIYMERSMVADSLCKEGATQNLGI